jgi:ATP-dependent Clp protease adaptor protein ClpS
MPTKTAQQIKIQPRLDLKPPSLYNIIYVNDATTTMEFVVETLKIVFGYDEARAMELTQIVHDQGSAVVATMPYEIAEQKGVEVTMLARSHGFPLQVRLEPEL